MRILAAVLTNARHIALYIARFETPAVERRREQQDQSVRISHQSLLDCGHRLAGTLGIAASRNHRPRLGYRVDLALIVGCGAKRSAIVEIGAAVPAPVP